MNGGFIGCSVSVLDGYLASAFNTLGSGDILTFGEDYEFQDGDNYEFQDGNDYEFN